MAKSKAVAKKENTDIATNAPEWMKQDAGVGLDDSIGSDDVEIPRLKLLQALSKEIDENEELRPGQFFHSIAEDQMGKELRLIPIHVFKSYILWRPRKDGGGILARAMDGVNWSPSEGEFEVKLDGTDATKTIWKMAPTVKGSGLDDWGSSNPIDTNSQPAATKMINIVAWLPDHPHLSPCVLTLQRGTMKVAKKFLGKLKMSNQPTFGMNFVMSSVKDQNANGEEFWSMNFKQDGFVSDEILYNDLKKLQKIFSDDGVAIKDLEGMEGEGQADVEKDADEETKF